MEENQLTGSEPVTTDTNVEDIMSRYALSVVAVLVTVLGFIGFATAAHAQTPPVDTPLYQTETNGWWSGDGGTIYQSHRETNDLRGVELGTVPWSSPVYAGACVNQGSFDPCYSVYKDQSTGLEYQGWMNNRDLRAPEQGWNISPQGGVGQPSYWEQGNGGQFIYRPGPVYNDAYYKGFVSGVGRSKEVWGYGYDAGKAEGYENGAADMHRNWMYSDLDTSAVLPNVAAYMNSWGAQQFSEQLQWGDPRLQSGYEK